MHQTHDCWICGGRTAIYSRELPTCCGVCQAPRRSPPAPRPEDLARGLLGLYGHVESVESSGTLDHVLELGAGDPATVRAWFSGLRALDVPALVAQQRARLPASSRRPRLGLDQALRDVEAEHGAGILAWRLEQLERRAYARLEAERRHHARVARRGQATQGGTRGPRGQGGAR